MKNVLESSRAEQVRRFVLEQIIEPRRSRGERLVTVRAGDVQRELGWWNRVPSVCSALDAREFQRMSSTRLVERRGPTQSTTAEWVFALSDGPCTSAANATSEEGPSLAARRLVAVWDGEAFRPVAVPEGLQSGQRMILSVSPVREVSELAGKFGGFVGTLSEEEADAMQDTLDRAFETISDEW